MKTHLSRRQGQSMIEFLFVSTLFILMLLISYNSVIAFSLQQYMSWITFMGARSFQAAAATPAAQEAAARRTLHDYGIDDSGKFMMKDFSDNALAQIVKVVVPSGATAEIGGYSLSEGPNPTNASAGTGKMIAIQASFRLMANVPFLSGSSSTGSLGTIVLWSKSYLGREPTTMECQKFFGSFLKKYTDALSSAGAPSSVHGATSLAPNMEDNGC